MRSRLGPVFIAGAGRVGSSLAAFFKSRGLEVCGLWSRRAISKLPDAGVGIPLFVGDLPPALPPACLLVIAVRDEATRAVADRLADAGLFAGARAVVHCSGAVAASEALGRRAIPVGTLHPLVAISSADQGMRVIPRCFFALEGNVECVSLCASYLRVLSVDFFTLAADEMARYHAAAVLASNHTLALWSAAQDLIGSLGGVKASQKQQILLPLIRSTLENTERYGLPEALTGPARRGDAATLVRHLDALAAHSPDLTDSYFADALLALSVAERCSGVDGDDLARARRELLRRRADLQRHGGGAPEHAGPVPEQNGES